MQNKKMLVGISAVATLFTVAAIAAPRPQLGTQYLQDPDSIAVPTPEAPSAIGQLYNLTAGSAYMDGCLGDGDGPIQCLCPIRLASDFAGTFLLAAAASDDPDFSVFELSGVDWTVGFGDDTLKLTGDGTYRVGTVDGEPFHRLQLDLVFNDDPNGEPQAFDSGLVSGGEQGELPTIDISADAFGLLGCFDILLDVAAAPIPSDRPELPAMLEDASPRDKNSREGRSGR